jgi:hypothetical protein
MDRNGRDVHQPFLVGLLGAEIPFEEIAGAVRASITPRGLYATSRLHRTPTGLAHQPSDVLPTAAHALGFQFGIHPRTAIRLLA